MCSKQSSRTTTLSVRYAAHLRRVVAHTHLFSSLTSAVLHLFFFWWGVCSYSGSSNRNGSSSKMQAARLVRPKRVRPTRPLRPTRTLRGAGAHGGLQTKRHTTRTPSRKSRLSCVSDRVWSFGVPSVFCPTLTFELLFFTPCERLQICVR